MPQLVAIFDLDGTLTTERSSWRFLHERLGIWRGRAERYQEQYLRGEIDYVTFCELDAREWAGIAAAKVEAIAGEIALARGVPETVAELRRLGFRLAIVSSGLDLLARRVARELGFDRWVANSLVARDGVLVGEAIVRVYDDNKLPVAEQVLRELGGCWERALAVGDSENDLPLLRRAAVGVAVAPESPKVAAQAPHVIAPGEFSRIAELARGVLGQASPGRGQ